MAQHLGPLGDLKQRIQARQQQRRRRSGSLRGQQAVGQAQQLASPSQRQLPPGIDPRAVAANPQGFAQQQAALRQAGGDPSLAARQAQQGAPPGGGLGQLLSRIRQGGGPQAAPGRSLGQRLTSRRLGARRRLQRRVQV